MIDIQFMIDLFLTIAIAVVVLNLRDIEKRLDKLEEKYKEKNEKTKR